MKAIKNEYLSLTDFPQPNHRLGRGGENRWKISNQRKIPLKLLSLTHAHTYTCRCTTPPIKCHIPEHYHTFTHSSCLHVPLMRFFRMVKVFLNANDTTAILWHRRNVLSISIRPNTLQFDSWEGKWEKHTPWWCYQFNIWKSIWVLHCVPPPSVLSSFLMTILMLYFSCIADVAIIDF